MKRLALLALTMSLSISAPAYAADYNFSFTTNTQLLGGPVTGSGVFTTSDVAQIIAGQTAFSITSITGTVNGSAIAAPTAASYGNYFTTGASFLDGTGVRFSTANGRLVTFFNQSSNGIYRVNTQSPGSSSFVTASSSIVTAGAVPEPSSWAMMIGGFGAIGGAARYRRRQAKLAFAKA